MTAASPADHVKEARRWQVVLCSSSCWVSIIPKSTARSSPSWRGCTRAATVRVIDSLAVYKDADGELEVEHLSDLSQDEAIELGSKIGALIGLGSRTPR